MALAGDRQHSVGQAGTQVTGRVGRIACGATETYTQQHHMPTGNLEITRQLLLITTAWAGLGRRSRARLAA
jgi:hypothetical protein